MTIWKIITKFEKLIQIKNELHSNRKKPQRTCKIN